MRNLIVTFITLFLSLTHLIGFGQEVLLDLQTLPVKEKAKATYTAKQNLSLPFFDDFAYNSSTPKINNWLLSGVLINQTYPINPPTIGVATFDAISRKGELYSTLSTTAFPADTLTSQTIDLNFPGDTNIYFSFYYQAKGLGKEPQTYDSLVLEFYDVDMDKWVRAWSASADFQDTLVNEKFILNQKTKTHHSDTLAKAFFMVHMPILDDRFKKSNFQFRFMNYASLSPNSTVPGLIGNSDHWNLDLVMIEKDKFFDDTIFNDVTYYKPLQSILNNYESIPWKHFNSIAKQTELPDPLYFNFLYRNLGPVIWNVTKKFVITDLSRDYTPDTSSAGSDDILPLSDTSFIREYIYNFESSWVDSAKFLLKNYLDVDDNNNNDPRHWNDTLTYIQQFHNYYAFDDGSAENGYGLFGAGSQNGMVAVKFHSYEADSLKGIMIYFNRTYQDASQQYFKLTVWDDDNGKPGNIIYQKIGVKPIFTDSLNVFTLIGIGDKLKIGGDFYIGWVQTTAEMLNVGFDLNNIHNSKLFFNLSGQWVSSQFEGSLMIRPVFGKLTKNPTIISKPKESFDFGIYPNPASNLINLETRENSDPAIYRIINFAGQVIINRNYTSNTIDVSGLPAGIYIIQLTSKKGTVSTQKLIISR